MKTSKQGPTLMEIHVGDDADMRRPIRSIYRQRIVFVPWNNPENLFGVLAGMALSAADEIAALDGPPQTNTFEGTGSLIHRIKHVAHRLALHAVNNNQPITTRILADAAYELDKLIDFAGGSFFDESMLMLEIVETCRALRSAIELVKENWKRHTQLLLPVQGLISASRFWECMPPWKFRDQNPDVKLVKAFDAAVEAGCLRAAIELFEDAHDPSR